MKNEKIDIVSVIKDICSKSDKSDDYFYLLSEIYLHISQHENEPEDQQAESTKRIIDNFLGGE